MTNSANPAGTDIQGLFRLFAPAEYMTRGELVPPGRVPAPYQQLLVNEHHMTLTLEAHHGDLVDVKVLEYRVAGDSYARKILLALQKSGRVVMFGLMRVNFQYCSDEVRREIVSGQTPLGRILIEHNVLRRIEPTAFLRVFPAPAMEEWFGLDQPRPTYGRFALIHCDEQPAVELLEIVAPEPAGH
jgi:chorismate-pyruvate lyase